jgi:acetyl-CoA C-acetyltransferase
MPEPLTAEQIGTPGPDNRMVASPYPKLMTSNINVDQAAAVVICSLQTALDHGVPRDRMTFPLAGSGGYDVWETRNRWEFDESPALRIAGTSVLAAAGLSVDDIALLDLYSCFPSAVQVAQRELDFGAKRPFTITGGLTFAGGPFNSYCMHALVRAVELLRESPGDRALLSGNGGFFTKHSFLVLGGGDPPAAFTFVRPQAQIDAEPIRNEAAATPSDGTVDTYTVTYDREGEPDRAIVAVMDADGSRTLTNSTDPETIEILLETDACGSDVRVEPAENVPISTITQSSR